MCSIPFPQFWQCKSTFCLNFFWSIICPTAWNNNSTSSKVWCTDESIYAHELMRTRAHLCKCVCVCVCVCKPQDNSGVGSRDHPFCLLSQGLSLASYSPNWLGWLASKLQASACLGLHNGIASVHRASFSVCLLGIQLKCSYMKGKCLIEQAIVSVLQSVLC